MAGSILLSGLACGLPFGSEVGNPPNVSGEQSCQTLLDLSASGDELSATLIDATDSEVALVNARQNAAAWEMTGTQLVTVEGPIHEARNGDGNVFVFIEGREASDPLQVFKLTATGSWTTAPFNDPLNQSADFLQVSAVGAGRAVLTVSPSGQGFVLSELGHEPLGPSSWSPLGVAVTFQEGPDGSVWRITVRSDGTLGGGDNSESSFDRWTGSSWVQAAPGLLLDGEVRTADFSKNSQRGWVVAFSGFRGVTLATFDGLSWSEPESYFEVEGARIQDLDIDPTGCPILTLGDRDPVHPAIRNGPPPVLVRVVRRAESAWEVLGEVRRERPLIHAPRSAVVGDSLVVGWSDIAPDAFGYAPAACQLVLRRLQLE